MMNGKGPELKRIHNDKERGRQSSGIQKPKRTLSLPKNSMNGDLRFDKPIPT